MKNTKPITYYSETLKAYIPDLNRCPECGETLAVGASGRMYCASDKNCSMVTVGQISKKAMKLYFPNK